jgi:L-asparaginase / beta-aspartyl-peptidase
MGLALAIHGGAGVLRRTTGDLEHGAERETLSGIRDRAWAALASGDRALDVVERAVVELEECPLFNAGRGSVLHAGGGVELDAAIMDGTTRRAGAVGAVDRIRTIRAARRILEASPHVLLVAEGAHAFAREHGLELVAPTWFVTEARRAQWERLNQEAAGSETKAGTVGAVATDREGHVAAATSTGGMAHKAVGRVGDTPVIGAGTYAWDRTCAVSGTGHGELFLRLCLAHRVSSLVEAAQTLDEAARRVIVDLGELGGTGGLIAVDRSGRATLAFNSGGMYRAWRTEAGEHGVAVW